MSVSESFGLIKEMITKFEKIIETPFQAEFFNRNDQKDILLFYGIKDGDEFGGMYRGDIFSLILFSHSNHLGARYKTFETTLSQIKEEIIKNLGEERYDTTISRFCWNPYPETSIARMWDDPWCLLNNLKNKGSILAGKLLGIF